MKSEKNDNFSQERFNNFVESPFLSPFIFPLREISDSQNIQEFTEIENSSTQNFGSENRNEFENYIQNNSLISNQAIFRKVTLQPKRASKANLKNVIMFRNEENQDDSFWN